MTDNDDSEEGLFRLETVPPPDGDGDAYNAPTKVGPMASSVIQEMILAAQEAADRAYEATKQTSTSKTEPPGPDASAAAKAEAEAAAEEEDPLEAREDPAVEPTPDEVDEVDEVDAPPPLSPSDGPPAATSSILEEQGSFPPPPTPFASAVSSSSSSLPPREPQALAVEVPEALAVEVAPAAQQGRSRLRFILLCAAGAAGLSVIIYLLVYVLNG